MNVFNNVKGHRKRKKQQMSNISISEMLDVDLLEVALFYCIPRRDVRPMSKKILRDFKTLGNFLQSEEHLLQNYDYCTDNMLFFFKIIKALLYKMTLHSCTKIPVLKTWNKVLDFLKNNISFGGTEKMIVLFLDHAYKLKYIYYQEIGCIDETPLFIRDILKKAISSNASNIVLSHNHPSGNPQPSDKDIEMTRRLSVSCATLNIKLLDHIIVSHNDHYSFAENEMIHKYGKY